MHPARIAELLEPFLPTVPNSCHSEEALAPEACPERSRRESAVLSFSQLQSISTYIDILLRWNARINLTAIRDPEDIVPRHFGESLFAARHLFPNLSSVSPVSSVIQAFDSPRVADLGSGAGFPGIPIKLWAPQIALTLIESNHKKAAFLREVAHALTLTNINILNVRAENLSATQTFDLVTLRAVERFEDVLAIAASLVAPGGRLALLIGSAQLNPASTKLPTFSWDDPLAVPNSRSRILLVGHRKSVG